MMAKSRLFDNIMQVISVSNTIAGATVISTEVDLELPRGYVAKVHKVRVQFQDCLAKMVNAELDEVHYALLLDPDDAATIAMPHETVEHDVILSGQFQYGVVVAAHGGLWNSFEEQWDFSHLEGLDILSARNMRFNCAATADYVDGAEIECQIWYTLEAIQDKQIMELLDIL